MLSDEIIKYSDWAGSFICPKPEDKRSPIQKRFEHD